VKELRSLALQDDDRRPFPDCQEVEPGSVLLSNHDAALRSLPTPQLSNLNEGAPSCGRPHALDKGMSFPSENENWIIEAGDAVIQKQSQGGPRSLAPWERLVYCLWVTDYGMRNAGDLEAARQICADFQGEAQRLAKDLSLLLTYEAFTLPPSTLQKEYFQRLDQVCDEIRAAKPEDVANNL
jgi:hypothetical protein